MVMTSRTNLFLSATDKIILRAASRWETLWNYMTTRLEEQGTQLKGFNRHASELSWFIRLLIKVETLELSESRYMQLVPTDSISDLHSFLQKYKDAVV